MKGCGNSWDRKMSFMPTYSSSIPAPFGKFPLDEDFGLDKAHPLGDLDDGLGLGTRPENGDLQLFSLVDQ